MGPELSFAAELLLLAVDPEGGGLIRRRRRLFRRALAAASVTDRGGRRRPIAWVAWRARRRALRELEHERLVERRGFRRRLRIVDYRRAVALFDRLRDRIEQDALRTTRDRELFVLLAWTGVLARRLAKSGRRTALQRLRSLVRESGDTTWCAPRVGRAPMSHGVAPLGPVALRGALDLFAQVVVAGTGGGDIRAREPALQDLVGYSAAINEVNQNR